MQRPIQFDSISIERNTGTSWLTTQQSSWRLRAIRCLHLDILSNYSIFLYHLYIFASLKHFDLFDICKFFPSSFAYTIKLLNNDHVQVAGLNVHPVDSISSCAHLLKVGIANRSLFHCSFVFYDHIFVQISQGV